MRIPYHLYLIITTRLAQLRALDERDRGDSPVPTAIIIAGLAFIAFGIITAAGLAVTGWMDTIPDAPAP